jgi:hypothetical protein
MGPPRQRLTRIAGYRIGGDQSGGTGTILQTCHELASFQLVELHLIPANQSGTAAWSHAAVRHHRAQSPQYLSKPTSGGTIDEALACQGGSASSAAAKVFPIPAFSFQGSDSLPAMILAKQRPKFPTALREPLAKPLLKQDP